MDQLPNGPGIPELYLMMGRMEGKVDSFLSKLESHQDRHKELQGDIGELKERVAVVEKRSWIITGAALVLGPILGYLGPHVADLFKITLK